MSVETRSTPGVSYLANTTQAIVCFDFNYQKCRSVN